MLPLPLWAIIIITVILLLLLISIVVVLVLLVRKKRYKKKRPTGGVRYTTGARGDVVKFTRSGGDDNGTFCELGDMNKM
jgi:NADH:ubiquinone oxidoreductase subunit 3 (subunit A)